MAATTIHPPADNPGPPPEEISYLSRICYIGDLDVNVVNETFRNGLEAFEQKGHSLLELWPVLLSAVQSARPKIIKLLLSRGLVMNEMYIRQAIETRSKQVFQAFLESGWDVNTLWDNFHPPILACFVDDLDFTQWLLDRGANPDAGCYLDLTSLSFAVRRAQPSLIKLLLDRGSIEKGQLVHHAVERSEDAIEVLQMLVSRGASINKIQYSEHLDTWNHEHFKGLGTPLHRAVELRKVDVAQYLLQLGADQNIKDTKGRTPKDIARDIGDADLIRLFESSY
ncbi:ankyrin [Cucurbitaria berberidis CBS 394.84]|uniref:Ankyrin n=1 Tax=Cucurbitaria berberidis CBS 394.84 TaxID=1168544 RepID=A0A9P4GD89_9PLEO|nr:ankyrin [Cucurbitaria berberidis CBS 394.84]KAF1843450.1 ankyrin [Cucurbitaria berberidis CBS 394.84]